MVAVYMHKVIAIIYIYIVFGPQCTSTVLPYLRPVAAPLETYKSELGGPLFTHDTDCRVMTKIDSFEFSGKGIVDDVARRIRQAF